MHLLPDDRERTAQIRAYVEQHYRDNITYATLTAHFHISERKLSADFKKQYNQTIYEFLTIVRVEKAKELLVKTYHPVKAIARGETASWRKQLNIPQFMDQLFFENGFQFLQRQLT